MPQLCLPIDLEVLVLPEGRMVSQRYDFSRQPWHNGSYDVNSHLPPTATPVQNAPFADQQLYLEAGLHLHFVLPDLYFQSHLDGANDFSSLPIPNQWWVVKEDAQGKRLKTWVVESDYVHPPGAFHQAVTLPIDNAKAPNTPPFRHIGRQVSIVSKSTVAQPLTMTASAFEASSQAARHYHQLSSEDLQAFLLGDMDYLLYYPNCHSILGFHDPDFDLETDKEAVYRVFGSYSSRLKTPLPEIWKGVKSWLAKNSEAIAQDFDSLCCYGGISFDAKAKIDNQEKEVAVDLALGHTPAEAQLAHLSHLSHLVDTQDNLEKTQDRLQAAERVEELDLQSRDRVIQLKRLIHAERFDKSLTPYRFVVRDKTSQEQRQKAQQPRPIPQTVKAATQALNEAVEDHLAVKIELDSTRHQLFNDWQQYINLLYPRLASNRPGITADQIRQYLEANSLPAIIALKKRKDEAEEKAIKLLTNLDDAIREYEGTQALEVQKLPGVSFQKPQNPCLSLVEKSANSLIFNDPGRETVPQSVRAEAFHLQPDNLTIPNAWQLPNEKAQWAAQNIRLWKRQDFMPLTLAWQVYLDPERTEPVKHYHLNETFPLKFMDKEYQLEDYLSFDYDLDGSAFPPYTTHSPGYYSGYSTLQTPDKRNLQKKVEALKAAPETYGVQDMVKYLQTLEESIDKTNSLQVALHGFNAACLMGHERLELKIADPLGFESYQRFSAQVAKAVGHEIRFSPLGQVPFNPFKEGKLAVKKLTLISSFGLNRTLTWTKTNVLEEHRKNEALWLSPGLAQAARLLVKTQPSWRLPKLKAFDLQQLVTSFFDKTGEGGNPIFGFVALNSLNRSLIIYNQEGHVLGRINSKGWLPTGTEAEGLKKLDNPHLHQWINALAKPDHFSKVYNELKRYFRERSIGQEQAHDFLQQGRPLALGRLELSLALQGLPAVHQGLAPLKDRINGKKHTEGDFSQTAFEIALGNEMAQHEGLVAIWPEGRQITPSTTGTGKLPSTGVPLRFVKTDDIFENTGNTRKKKKHSEIGKISETRLYLKPNATGVTFTCLFDPTRPITIQSGILPDLHWQLPEAVYGPVLKKLQPLLFSPYLITAAEGSKEIPLPIQPQSRWTLLLPGGKSFREELMELPTLNEKGIIKAFRQLKVVPEQHESLKRLLMDQGVLLPLIKRQDCFKGTDWLFQTSDSPDLGQRKGLREVLLYHCRESGILQPLSAWHFELSLNRQEAEIALKTLPAPFSPQDITPIINHLYQATSRPAGYRLGLDKTWSEVEAKKLESFIPENNQKSAEAPVQGGGAMQKAARLTKALKIEIKQLVATPDLNARHRQLSIQDGYLALNYQDQNQ